MYSSQEEKTVANLLVHMRLFVITYILIQFVLSLLKGAVPHSVEHKKLILISFLWDKETQRETHAGIFFLIKSTAKGDTNRKKKLNINIGIL